MTYLPLLKSLCKLFELSPTIMQIFSDMSRNIGNIRFKPFIKYCYGNFNFN